MELMCRHALRRLWWADRRGERTRGRRSFTAEYKKPKLYLRLSGDGDMLLEKWALANKSSLFEEVFSTKLVVEE